MFLTMKLFLLFVSALLLTDFAACAPPAKSRIIGGNLANAGQFPFAAAIYKTTADGNYFCGGSLLNVLYVLTAGQCVEGAVVFTILLGTTHLEEEGETRLRLAAETYKLHPDYNPQTLEHDIGLIRFRERITLTAYISQVVLTFNGVDPGDDVKAIGWGQTSDSEGELSNDLRWVHITALSNEECQIYYGNQIKETMFCAIGQYNEGLCYGDIGGPVTANFNSNPDSKILRDVHIGIASFVSSNGCESTNPSGYTRSYPYIRWILNNTNINAPA